MLDVHLLEGDLDAVAAHVAFMAAHGARGAVVSFTGLVRADGGTEALYLDWYPGMTEASLREIGDAAMTRFAPSAAVILHRCGEVLAGQPIVFVAVASPHRRAAFEAADYMMDRLKSEAALWKREVTADGGRWVEPRPEDAADLRRWK